MVNVRCATADDRAAIRTVHEAAFVHTQGPEIVALVDDLLGDASARPLHSLVAEVDGKVVGHVLFTAVTIQPGVQETAAQILAPLAVLPAAQGKGVGGAPVNAGLRLLAAAGVALVFVLGYPDYYSRSDSARRGRWVWPRLIQSPPSMTPPGWCWRCGRACSARYMAWCSAPIP